jgi:hypothetical protein
MLMQRRAPPPAGQSTFELQIFRDGRWIISAVYDDRHVALSEAHRVDKGGRMVRLMEESGDGDGARTVFLSAKIRDTWKAERQRIAAGAHHPPTPHGRRVSHHSEINPYRLLALFSLVAFLGLAAILALRTLYTAI